LIREKSPISVEVLGAKRVEGWLVWQDSEFLAIERNAESRLILVSRRQVCVIRSLS